MTDNQFDHFVRTKLHDHSAPVPAGLWDKVNPAKDDDDRKGFFIPKIYRWGLPLLLLVGSLTGYFIFNSNTDSGNTNSQATVAQTAANNGSSTENQKNTNNETQATSDKNETVTSTTTASTNQQSQAATKLADNPNTVTGTTTNYTSLTPASNQPSNGNNQTGKIASDNPLNDITISSSKRNDFTKGNIESFSMGNKSQNSNLTAPNISNNKQIKADESANAERANSEESYQYPVSLNMPFQAGYTINADRNSFGLSGLAQRTSLNTAYSKKYKSVIVCPPYKVRNTDWFAEVYVSPDLAFKTVENRSATAQYLAKKDSSESMRIGYSAGVRIVKPITDNFLVKTGLQYTQINEKFTYRTEDEVKTTTVISVRTIIRGPGDTLRISDTSTVTQVGFKTNSIKNRYRSFDIPVTVGYQFGNDNLKLGINAGVIFNISSWYQGVILDSSLAAVPISKGSNQVYKNNIGLGLYGGISLLKKIGDNTQLFFEPYFRYNLSGITSGQASYQQKFSLGGLSIGLRYNLNRQ